MSNNVNITPKVISRLTLFGLGGRLKVAKAMNPGISAEFGKKEYKVGDSIKLRKPYRFIGHDNIGWQPEATVDQVFDASVKQVAGVHWLWDSVERTLDVREAMRLYSDPVSKAMGAKINNYAATFAANNAHNSVGTPGTAPTTQATYLAGGDVLIEQGLPDDEALKLIINRKMSTAYVNGTVAYYNPAGAISAQYMKGKMVDSLGYDIEFDQTIATRTNGTFSGTVLVNGAQQAEGGNNATMTLTIDGITGTLLQGDRFTLGSASSATVGGVESVHPQTRVSTGRQQVFTVQQDSAANPTSIVVAPAITPQGQYQNVNTGAVDNAIITMIGTTGLTGITCGLLMHEDAFAFISVPLVNPTGGGVEAAESETDPETNLSIQYVRYFDGDNRQTKHRFDSLYDCAKMYGELACVIQA